MSISLVKAQVRWVDRRSAVVACNLCDQVWAPKLRPGGGLLPRCWWHCPNGCNYPLSK